MTQAIDGLALFPLVFASLVLQKTYAVSKSALVPSTVRSEEELVEANAKLGLVAGHRRRGDGRCRPAILLLVVLGPSGALVLLGVLLFGFALSSSSTQLGGRRSIADDVARTPPRSDQLHSGRLRVASVVMTVLRANVGFLFFHLAFYLRGRSTKGTLVVRRRRRRSRRCRRWWATRSHRALRGTRIGEEAMLTVALVLSCHRSARHWRC